ncbi:MAG: potassium channel family protein [Candidatus Hodarchaeota archaeon]
MDSNKEFEVNILKEQVLRSLSFPKTKTISAKIIAIWLIFSSLLYGTIAILETNINLQQQLEIAFTLLSCITGFSFLLEYSLRVWSYNQKARNEDSIPKRLNYVTSIMGIIDFLSAISFIFFLISFFFNELMEIARLLRLFVFFKFTRYSRSFEIILAVIKRKKEELLITLMLSLILMFFGATLIYISEHEAQPDKITNLFGAMWFTAINLFTIGYGDIVPLTPFGKIVSGSISFIGITLFLLPASVIVSGFLEELEERKPTSEVCPNCKVIIQKSEFIRKLRKQKIKKKTLEIPSKGNYKKKIYKLIQFKFPNKLGQKVVFIFFLSIITLNILAIMIGTNPEISLELNFLLNSLLIFSIITFSIEYVLRVWCIVASKNPTYNDPIRGRLRYVLRPIAIIDIITLFTLYLMFVFSHVRILVLYLQILRMLVIFKIGHFIDVFRVARLIFKETKREFLVTVMLCWIFLMFASTLIYYMERNAQPTKFADIPTTLWMGIITFTTTGFGDVYAITTGGRFCTIALAFLGVSLFILPAGILGSNFFSTMQEYRYYKICPKCEHIIIRPKIKISD